MPLPKLGSWRVAGALTAGVLVLAATGCTPEAGATGHGQNDATRSVNANLAAAPRAATSPSPLPSIGEAQPDKWPDLQATINSLHRDSSGLVTLTWTLKNNGKDDFHVGGGKFGNISPGGNDADGVTLTDETAKMRYSPLRTVKQSQCLCSTMVHGMQIIPKGYTMPGYGTYKLPPQARNVTVTLPGFGPVRNVPIS